MLEHFSIQTHKRGVNGQTIPFAFLHIILSRDTHFQTSFSATSKHETKQNETIFAIWRQSSEAHPELIAQLHYIFIPHSLKSNLSFRRDGPFFAQHLESSPLTASSLRKPPILGYTRLPLQKKGPILIGYELTSFLASPEFVASAPTASLAYTMIISFLLSMTYYEPGIGLLANRAVFKPKPGKTALTPYSLFCNTSGTNLDLTVLSGGLLSLPLLGASITPSFLNDKAHIEYRVTSTSLEDDAELPVRHSITLLSLLVAFNSAGRALRADSGDFIMFKGVVDVATWYVALDLGLWGLRIAYFCRGKAWNFQSSDCSEHPRATWVGGKNYKETETPPSKLSEFALLGKLKRLQRAFQIRLAYGGILHHFKDALRRPKKVHENSYGGQNEASQGGRLTEFLIVWTLNYGFLRCYEAVLVLVQERCRGHNDIKM
ncbi:uncharacterized protein BDR25DRAFT_362689 [Lindgomyces ingoldianus]|uniref:Uncharacterized protein n=1 Tax=Lindgomyces ingoldianus TaxID=673940 RepID=A0ACB6Q9D7_9PLEO|nr:uncharacterized protein BDR25DRAFT_362689 [Lindgomyces ingoldianus]KAF2463517.1 hypothetical protein BDR25DRAFT_362689 [Lindgomyces ingoldianus]